MAATIKINEIHTQRLHVAVARDRGVGDRGYETAWRVLKSDNARPVPFEAHEAFTAIVAEHPIGETYLNLSGVVLMRHDVREEGPNIYLVTGTYGVPDVPDVPDDFDQFINQSQSQRSEQNPNGAELSKSVMVIEEYDYKDLRGNWFTNSAGDPLQTLIPIPVTIQVRRVTLNVRNDPDDSQVGMADGRKLFADVQATSELHHNRETNAFTPYWRATYEMWIHTRRDWVPTVVWDAGYNEIKVNAQGQAELVPIVNPKTEEPYNSIRFLNGAGVAIPPPNPPGIIQPVPREFYVREEGQFQIPILNP